MRYQRSDRPHRHSVLTAVLTIVILCTTFMSMPATGTDAASKRNGNDGVRFSKVVIDSGRTLTVNASAAQGVLPDGAVMRVRIIKKNSEDHDAVGKKLERHIKQQDKALAGFLAYEISFRHEGKEIKPDGSVAITMKWSDEISPDGGVRQSDQVSVICLKERKNDSRIKDSKAVDLTVNKEKKKNQQKEQEQEKSKGRQGQIDTADVNTNKQKEVKSARITVEHSNILTFAWIQKQPIGEQSDQGKNSTEKGGQPDQEERTSDQNTAKNQKRNTARNTAGQAALKNRKHTAAKKQKQNEGTWQGKLHATAGDYDVTVFYGKDAKIPAGATLRVKPVNAKEEAYQSAKAAVLSQKGIGIDADSLGMAALDISIMYDGKEFEPAQPVSVSVCAKHLPAEAKSIEMHHITSGPTSPLDHVNRLASHVPMRNNMAVSVATGANVRDGKAEVRFSVDGFSVFTITWSLDRTDNTRIGQVKVRYVDSNGLEVDTASEFDADDLAKMAQKNGGVVDLSSWANKTTTVDGNTTTTSRVTGYTFDHAAIGSRDGTTITGVKVEKNENDTQKVQTDTNTYSNVKVTTYKLYYTTDSTVSNDSKWTLYRDSASGQSDNNANIYLIYRKDGIKKPQTDPTQITIHHVDSDGNQVADNTSATYWFNSDKNTTYARWNGASGIIGNNGNNTFSGLHSISGLTYTNTAYIGVFGNDSYKAISNTSGGYGSLFYKRDSSGVWHTGTGTMNGNGSDNTVTNELKDSDGNAALYTDVYLVYSNVKGVTVHFVDEKGKEIAEGGYALTDTGTFTASDKANSSSSLTTGYTYKEARIGSANGSIFTTINYTKADNGSWTSTVKNGEATVDTSGVPNEVWLVYTKNSETKTFTVNYKYINTSGTASNAYYLNSAEDTETSKTTDTFNVTSGNTKQLVRDSSTTSGWADIIHDGLVRRAAASGETGAQSLYYQSTHLGSVDGPEISSVDVDSDGNIVYRNSYSATLSPSQQSPNRYTGSAGTGRSFVLTQDDDGNLSIEDSRNGTFELNYANDTSGEVGAAYTATFHGENETTEYKVTKSSSNDAYTLDVEAYIPSTNTQIYQTYIDSASEGNRKIWIDNDIMYSGLFKVGTSDQVTQELGRSGYDNAPTTDISYEWTRIVTKDGTTTETVLNDSNRKQTGDHWNIAADAQQRTWVDIEADEGSDTWRTGTTVSYRVKLTYKHKDSTTDKTTEYTLTSEPVTVNYYGQLENGSFETPTNVDTKQWPQSDYLAAGGVWKTTGPEGGSSNRDIEIQSVKSGNSGVANYWRNGELETNTSAKDTPVAKDGEHFAELNCEKAGALYQDVITHPNETLSYGFSHRARIPNIDTDENRKATHIDSMYLVIMPTSLAMTSGKNNTELTEQGDVNTPGTLVYFINKHGGYDTTKATEEEDRITYSDYDNGILIRKISSDNFDWHNISVTNGYTAKGGLTRFFFVAGTTATNNATEGNFIDDVSFSQSLPTPKGFNLTVTKTFTGLTQSQLAAMASNNNKSNPFEFTISNEYTQSNQTYHNKSLQNTKLRFKATPSGTNSYTFTAIAVDSKGDDLFEASDGNTGTARYNNGTLTLTWTFTNQSLPSSALDRTFRYTVAETNGSVSGLTQTPTYSLNGGTTQSGTSGTINVHQGDTARYAFSNAYKENAGDDSQITVRKVFSGVTETTVNKLLSQDNPYSITVTKTQNSAGTAIPSNQSSITLTPSTSGSVKDTNSDQTYDVSYSLAEDSATGKVTLTWIIKAPEADDASGLLGTAGVYKVSETNFTPTPQQGNGDNNILKGVTVNGKNVTSDLKGTTITEENIYVGKVGENDYSPSISAEGTAQGIPENKTATLSKGTNVIIAKTSTNKYLVWTPETVGANLRQAFVKKINAVYNSTEGSTQASLDDVYFYSGENPGELKTSQHEGMSMTYNSVTRTLSFSNPKDSEDTVSWSQYYASTYSVTAGSTYSEGMTNNGTEMRVANIYDPIIKIRKVSSGSNSEDLAGAKFKLYKKSGGSTLYYIGNNASSSESWTSDSTKAKEYETTLQNVATDGETTQQAIVTIGDLPKSSSADGDTYYLEEVTAPNGYNKLTKPISFKINSDGTVVLGATEDAVDNSKAEVTFPDPYYVITVRNIPGILLPFTGGMGRWWLFLLGMVLASMAVAMWRRRKKNATT